MSIVDDEYVVIPTGFNADGDPIIHSDVYPFCGDPQCPCHEDQGNIDALNEALQAGLATVDDVQRVYRGGQV